MDREGYIPVEGGGVWYGVAGAGSPGAPLLVLHGGPGYPHDYLEPLAELSGERPVIFYDQLGCGRSERPADPSLWRVDRFVRELGQVRAALGLERAHLFGHSWGTMLAVDYLLAGGRVESLILASPALSIPRWMADAAAYMETMPAEWRETVARHHANGTTFTREYRDAATAYYRRYLCRMDTSPEPMDRSHDASSGAIYREMWGPSEFHATALCAITTAPRGCRRFRRAHSTPADATMRRRRRPRPGIAASRRRPGWRSSNVARTCRIWRRRRLTWTSCAGFCIGRAERGEAALTIAIP